MNISCADDDSLKCTKRLLVACDSLVLSGGLLRFERVGSILRSWGHKFAFVCFSEKKPDIKTQAPMISVEEAAAINWDAVMIPGAGFPEDLLNDILLCVVIISGYEYSMFLMIKVEDPVSWQLITPSSPTLLYSTTNIGPQVHLRILTRPDSMFC